MKTTALMALLAWATTSPSFAVEKVEYETAPAISIDYSTKQVKYIDAVASFDCVNQQATILDTVIPYFECGKSGDWISFSTPDLRFSYNLEWTSPPASWDHGADSYSLVGKRQSSHYGTYYRVVGFTPSEPGQFFVTDYSVRYGIIAFYHFDEDEGSSTWFSLTSKRGLGEKTRPR